MDSTGIVLAVDDDELMRTVLSTRLKALGYQVTVTESGEEAIRLAPELHPDCILLDIVMPGKDGYQTAKELRRLDSTKGVPIIMLSARRETESKVKGFAMAVNDYVTKPFNFDELNARIQVQIKLKRAEQAFVEREKQSALIDLVDGLADTLLNRLNLSLVQLQVVGHKVKNQRLDDSVEALENLRRSIWRSVEVVTELLKHTQKSNPGKPQSLALADWIGELSRDFQRMEFVTAWEEDLPLVQVPKSLKDAFRALCRNAWEAMQGGAEAPVLEIGASLDEDGEMLRISFRDRGVGIQPEALPKIFTPFFTTKGTKNSGLGLWTVHKTVESIGGRVDVRSEPGRGAEFVLSLPVRQPKLQTEAMGTKMSAYVA